jgi:hypothetical protein
MQKGTKQQNPVRKVNKMHHMNVVWPNFLRDKLPVEIPQVVQIVPKS